MGGRGGRTCQGAVRGAEQGPLLTGYPCALKRTNDKVSVRLEVFHYTDEKAEAQEGQTSPGVTWEVLA